jgi:hypothetical protein
MAAEGRSSAIPKMARAIVQNVMGLIMMAAAPSSATVITATGTARRDPGGMEFSSVFECR